MNRKKRLSVTLILFLTFSILLAAQTVYPLEGPYMGQTPPGDEPQIFALSFIGSGFHGCPVFTPNGMEAYWSQMADMKMDFSKVVDGSWTNPADIGLAAEHTMSDSPCLSIDGNRLFFVSTAPIGGGSPGKENIWYMDRDGDSWTTPQPLGNAINTNYLHWQFSIAENGNLYFSFLGPTGIDIAVSRYFDGQYTEKVVLGSEINSPGMQQEFAPFIAPDESYLIFSYVDDGSSNPFVDLFISFKNPDDTWSQAVAMDGLNTDGAHDMCANVTRDGLYLFFLRDAAGGIATHWVSADVIESYRPFICGDVNDDDEIDILDVIYIINFKYKSGPDPFVMNSADVNSDESIDILDVVYLIDFKYKSGPDPVCP